MSDVQQLDEARLRVQDALSLFTFASNEVSKANIHLAELISKKEAEREEIERTIHAANQDLKSNNQLKVRLDAFNPQR
ncbi:hypothetical protein ACP26L_36165 (plasmid) [Paenibacillus sp. S-38]|uniref:hypothetical protein n=1 Tax=Paenibacillus sp. S-38 TaxID=3416710 RepID=UPI003CF1FF89